MPVWKNEGLRDPHPRSFERQNGGWCAMGIRFCSHFRCQSALGEAPVVSVNLFGNLKPGIMDKPRGWTKRCVGFFLFLVFPHWISYDPRRNMCIFFSPPRGHWKFTKVANCSDTGSQLESGNLIGKAPSTWWPPRMIPPVPFWWENLNPPMRLVRMTWFLSVSWCEKLSFDKWPVFFSRYENYPILDEFPSQPTTPDFFYCHVWVLLHPGRWTAGTHKSPGIQTSE